MKRIKTILNILLLITFIITLLVPITGLIVHKISSCIFMLLTIIHTIIYHNKINYKHIILFVITIIVFICGMLAMILPLFINIHKVLSIIYVLFMGGHLFIYHKRLFKKKNL